MLASQSLPGPAAGPRAAHAASASLAPSRPRSWSRVMCSWIWVGCPARSGRHPAPISRRQASSSASWSRWPLLRVSSGPAFLPSASSTARSAAVHCGVRSPSTRPASCNVRSSRSHRSANPPSSSGSGPAQRRCISPASPARSARSAPPAAAASRIASASACLPAGSWPVQAQISRAHDAEMSPAASASPMAGCAARRRAHATAPAAAPRVTRVCQRSHARAEP